MWVCVAGSIQSRSGNGSGCHHSYDSGSVRNASIDFSPRVFYFLDTAITPNEYLRRDATRLNDAQGRGFGPGRLGTFTYMIGDDLP